MVFETGADISKPPMGNFMSTITPMSLRVYIYNISDNYKALTFYLPYIGCGNHKIRQYFDTTPIF